MNCKICNIENPELSHFWKVHKIKELDYYLKYFPKTDKLTGEVLAFKDRDSYLLNNFTNKNNFKKWLKLQSLEVRRDYLRQLLLNRKDLKKWFYTPTQVELRSCPEMAGIKTFNENFPEGYDKICYDVGYKSRGFTELGKEMLLKYIRDLRGNPILVDSREQSILDFGNKEINISTLPVGDYTVKNDNYNIYIERKSTNDLISTFGPKNFKRFSNELQRAKEMGEYIILLVENDFNTVLGFDHSPFFSKHTQMTSVYLFHQIRVLLQKFPNWQIAFCRNRTEMKESILKIFKTGPYWKTHDLQLGMDLGLFNDGI
jgi:hypothetical protein